MTSTESRPQPAHELVDEGLAAEEVGGVLGLEGRQALVRAGRARLPLRNGAVPLSATGLDVSSADGTRAAIDSAVANRSSGSAANPCSKNSCQGAATSRASRATSR